MLLELTLQVAAFGLWLARPNAKAATDVDHVALCIGDSFTAGLGASKPKSFSYPASATRLAAEDGESSIGFVNGGTPGFSSRDVLQNLPTQIQESRPELVYLLVGTNDLRMRPARLEVPPGTVPSTGFPIRFRVGRLVRITADWLFGEQGDAVDSMDPADQNDPNNFVGLWHSEDLEIRFEPDGRLRFGEVDLSWSDLGSGKVELQFPNGNAFEAVWERRRRRLYLECEIWAQSYLLEPGPLPGPVYDILREHLATCARVCEEAGARLTLLCYPGGPFAKPGLNSFLENSAAELGLNFIDLDAHFAPLRAGPEGATYYAPDGHCSDRGYAEIARLVVEHARQSVR